MKFVLDRLAKIALKLGMEERNQYWQKKAALIKEYDYDMLAVLWAKYRAIFMKEICIYKTLFLSIVHLFTFYCNVKPIITPG